MFNIGNQFKVLLKIVSKKLNKKFIIMIYKNFDIGISKIYNLENYHDDD